VIAGIHGLLQHRGSDHVIVRVGGFDIRVSVSHTSLAQLGSVGAHADIHTVLYVREDILALYGFVERQELEFFDLLITVSGVGPRLALTLLSTFTPGQLRAAIARDDATALARAPGVGKRIAQRLVLELKARVGAGEREDAAPGPAVGDDVLDALVSLGLTPAEAHQASYLPEVRDAGTTEEKITRALQQYASRRH